MTGEVTLRGNALAIGGLKEKITCCLRGGIKTVLIPEEMRKIFVDIPDNVKSSLEIIAVKNVSEVLKIIYLDARPNRMGRSCRRSRCSECERSKMKVERLSIKIC